MKNCLSGKVILASTKSVYVLVPLPLEKQIQDLLANQRVEEALVLTEGAQRNIPKDKFQVSFWLKDFRVTTVLGLPHMNGDTFVRGKSYKKSKNQLFVCSDFAQKNPATGRFHTVWHTSVSRSKRILQVGDRFSILAVWLF